MSLVEAARKALRELTTTGRWHAAVSIAAREDVQCLADPLELELVAMNLIKRAGSRGRVSGRYGEYRRERT